MKNKKKKLLYVLLTIAIMIMACAVNVSAKTYSYKTVTAKQIVTELKKTFGLKNIEVITKSSQDTMYGTPYSYKSKVNFTDKKYPKIYCSIEVFKNSAHTYRRAGYLEALSEVYKGFGIEVDVPYKTYIWKNVLIRLNGTMPKSYEKKYLAAVKKIVK